MDLVFSQPGENKAGAYLTCNQTNPEDCSERGKLWDTIGGLL